MNFDYEACCEAKNEVNLNSSASYRPHMPQDEKVVEELVAMRRLLEMLAKDAIKKELDTIATTAQRRKTWALCDGVTSTAEIAQKTGVSTRAVQMFISELEQKDLITTERRGYPKRKFDLVPSDWGIREVMRRA